MIINGNDIPILCDSRIGGRTMKRKYYKPKTLVYGILLFGISLFLIGALMMINVKDGIQDSKDALWTIGFVASIIGMSIGEFFILDASSYTVKDVEVLKDVAGEEE